MTLMQIFFAIYLGSILPAKRESLHKNQALQLEILADYYKFLIRVRLGLVDPLDCSEYHHGDQRKADENNRENCLDSHQALPSWSRVHAYCGHRSMGRILSSRALIIINLQSISFD